MTRSERRRLWIELFARQSYSDRLSVHTFSNGSTATIELCRLYGIEIYSKFGIAVYKFEQLVNESEYRNDIIHKNGGTDEKRKKWSIPDTR